MSFEEKLTWVNATTTVIVVLVYAWIVGGQVSSTPVDQIPYQPPMIVAAVAIIVLTIIGAIVTAIGSAVTIEITGEGSVDDIDRSDERDKSISRRGDRRLLRVVGADVRRAGHHDARVPVLLDRERDVRGVRHRRAGLVGGQTRRVPEGLLAMVKPTKVTNSIRALRFAAGEMTQAELADRVGMTRQTVIAIEQGRYSPSLEVAFKIARVLNVPLDEVFHYPEEDS